MGKIKREKKNSYSYFFVLLIMSIKYDVGFNEKMLPYFVPVVFFLLTRKIKNKIKFFVFLCIHVLLF